MYTQKKCSLDGLWQMCWFPHEDVLAGKTPPHSLTEMGGFGPAQTGTVPGNFELDLQNSGILPDLFYGTNALLTQKYEGYHVCYARTFDYREVPGTLPHLVFEGIDTLAEIYLNGTLIAKTDNMFIPWDLEPRGLREGENELLVHLLPACVEVRANPVSAGNTAMTYNYESLRLRKAAHMFGWDIMPRIVSCGIFRPVSIEYRPIESIRQAYLMTTAVDPVRNTADLTLFYDTEIHASDLSTYTIEVEGLCGGSRFSAKTRLWFTSGKLKLRVENARLWWPKGSGEPALYSVSVLMKKDGNLLDERNFNSGLRTVGLTRTSTTDAFFSGKFQFEVNGKRIFILGTNFVPIDALHARDRERLPQVCELLDDTGCNAIRCWGGNVYEEDYLFDFCDAHGILIWQDFMMACAVYPIDEAFGGVIANEVTVAVRRLRNHASILVWAGDNENDMFAEFEPFHVNPNRNHITRKVIPDVLAFEDPARPYLPSSPYIDEEGAKVPMEYLTEHHLWGPRDYFRSSYYTGSVCAFASELGYHGSPSVKSILEFMPEAEAWPWQDNPHWCAHAACPELQMQGTYGGRIHLMADQIKELFGTIPETLPDFALASQISQAEAFKFFIELFRQERWNRTGIIWWNLIDGWPQFSDAVVDYYFRKKLAYYYICQVQKPVLLSFSAPKDWSLRLNAVNDTGKPLDIAYRVTEYGSGETILQGNAVVAEEVFTLASLRYSHGEKKIYLIDWTCGEFSGQNHFLCGEPPFDLDFYRAFLAERYGLSPWLE